MFFIERPVVAQMTFKSHSKPSKIAWFDGKYTDYVTVSAGTLFCKVSEIGYGD